MDLEHKEPDLREMIAEMIPHYPNHFSISLPLLEKAFAAETNENTKEFMQHAIENARSDICQNNAVEAP